MSPPSSATRLAFLMELSVAGRKMRTMFDRLMRKRGLTLSRARALLLLSRNGAVTQTELAAELEIEHPTVVRLLDGLERQELITRNAVDGDRRTKQIALTGKAEVQVVAIDSTIADLRLILLGDSTDEELAVASRVLTRLIHRIETMPASHERV